MSSQERLQRLLGGSELANLRKRLRRHFELGGESAVLTLTRISEIERNALAGLLGRPLRLADSMRIDISVVDAVLQRAQLADGLRHAIEILDGPIINRTAVRAALQNQWDEVRRACEVLQLQTLLAEPQGMGLLKRISRNEPRVGVRLCDFAQRVLRRLPAAGMARSQLAAEALGDAHALDQGRPVATLVLAALRWQRNDDGQPDESPREVWADNGVLVNELARPALFLNLPASGREFTPGEPSYLSLRELLRTPPRWEVAGRIIFVSENPNVVAIAADALGKACAPLVCTDGMPAAAQRTLLAQLAAADAHLRYHGDFDWPGLNIGNCVMRDFGAHPWRYGTADYLAGMPAMDADDRHPLSGATVQADWDAGLAATMLDYGRAIDEEGVIDLMLSDLSGQRT
jgi:uncharacterized protein (TIGR02679 family)